MKINMVTTSKEIRKFNKPKNRVHKRKKSKYDHRIFKKKKKHIQKLTFLPESSFYLFKSGEAKAKPQKFYSN